MPFNVVPPFESRSDFTSSQQDGHNDLSWISASGAGTLFDMDGNPKPAACLQRYESGADELRVMVQSLTLHVNAVARPFLALAIPAPFVVFPYVESVRGDTTPTLPCILCIHVPARVAGAQVTLAHPLRFQPSRRSHALPTAPAPSRVQTGYPLPLVTNPHRPPCPSVPPLTAPTHATAAIAASASSQPVTQCTPGSAPLPARPRRRIHLATYALLHTRSPASDPSRLLRTSASHGRLIALFPRRRRRATPCAAHAAPPVNPRVGMRARLRTNYSNLFEPAKDAISGPHDS
ncbi:hypothetical protein B0H15DRAFT_957927 [Mycena belliarum]|uniref:Uncharacterized protein n=1 Tax=Mycena belliarum TaxID=1033014 RepID=A0AAD6XG54_9AGAR|nr:hypothetical protein B0H15DRAFT_957927 [Mycena belliae]